MELNNSFEISLRYTSFDQKAPELLKKYMKETLTQVSFSSIRLPVKKKRYTLLRSPHVNKKSRDQLEVCLYNGLICFQVHLIPFSFLKAIQELMAPYMALKVSIKALKKVYPKC